MKTTTLEIAMDGSLNETDFPNCYTTIPPNGQTCKYTGLRYTHLYTMLAPGGMARHYVRVVNLREPGATKGKTLFHVGDMLRFLHTTAISQGSGEQREKALDPNHGR